MPMRPRRSSPRRKNRRRGKRAASHLAALHLRFPGPPEFFRPTDADTPPRALPAVFFRQAPEAVCPHRPEILRAIAIAPIERGQDGGAVDARLSPSPKTSCTAGRPSPPRMRTAPPSPPGTPTSRRCRANAPRALYTSPSGRRQTRSAPLRPGPRCSRRAENCRACPYKRRSLRRNSAAYARCAGRR